MKYIRNAEKAGFDGVWASSLEISTAHAVPDASILTMQDYYEAACDINEAIKIPVVMDADTGYGNSNNVIRAVQKFEPAGIAAMCMEDKLFPKVNSLTGGRQELAPVAEFVGKIMAAKNAQEDKDFMVFTRIEALIAGWGMEEALKRAYAYEEAGSDGILIHSKAKDPKEIIEFVNDYRGSLPLILVPTTYPSLKLDDIKKLGKVKMVIYANHGIRSAVEAMEKTFSEIIEAGGTAGVEKKIAPMSRVFEIQGFQQMMDLEKRFLRTGQEFTRAIILAAGDASKQPGLGQMLADRPVGMLDLNGRPILQRTVENLKSLNVHDVTAVVGYKAESVNVQGLQTIKNPDFGKKWVLHSLMLAGQKMDERFVMVYSDLIFDKALIERLLKRNDDITLVIDPTFGKALRGGKQCDLVVAEKKPVVSDRMICIERNNPIKAIGKKIPAKKAGYEFIGIALFSKKGAGQLKKAYADCAGKYAGKPFHEAPSFEKASFCDIIQELIDNGTKVSSMEVCSGWSEIHTFEDYKRACYLLSHE